MASQGPIIVALVLGIIILILVSVIIYFLVIRSTGGMEGAICRSNEDCASGFYCGGSGRCHAGTEGGAVGAPCTINSDCQFGLLCPDGTCVNPLENNVPSEKIEIMQEIQHNEYELIEYTEQFTDKHLVTYMDGEKYYLHLAPSRAYISKFRPNALSYAHNTLFVRNIGRAMVGSNGVISMSNNSSHLELYQIAENHLVLYSPQQNALLRLNPVDLHAQFSQRDDWLVLDFHLQ